jgi:hypothetical protein
MSVEPSPATATAPPRRWHWRWQWSLTTLLLLTAAIAAWTAWFQVRRESDKLQREIGSMEELSRRFKVDDPSQFAVVEKTEMWYDDDRWEVYLPPLNDYVVKLVTRNIYATGFPEDAWVHPIPPGRHEIMWVIDKGNGTSTPRIVVFVDGGPVIDAIQDKEWTSYSWSGSGSYDRVQQFPITEPLELHRRRFIRPQPSGSASINSDEPAWGALLWIERVSKPPRDALQDAP